MLRRKKSEPRVSHERWLVSYADFITLLFAFFTTLYAISTVDAQKMGKMVMSMRASFDSGLFTSGSDRVPLYPSAGSSGSSFRRDIIQSISASGESHSQAKQGGPGSVESLTKLKKNVEALVGAEALKGRVRTHLDSRGLIISIGEGGFFDSGSDVIKPEGLKLLNTIASGLGSTSSHIRVEGHTDNKPIRNSRYPSNWELSTARATAVISHLITKFDFKPDRLSAAGYGEYRPTADNGTVEGRARNRRVDIVVLSALYEEMEPRSTR